MIMQVPLQVTIRDIDHSEAVENRIRQKAEKLNIFSDHIISCHVVVELTRNNRNQGNLHNVRITLTLPHKELTVNRNAQENLYMAIRDAFNDMTRQVEEVTRIQHGEIKTHPDLMHGEIVRLFKEEDFGFIASFDGEEYYFNAANVVHPKFDRLSVGTPVYFI